MAKESRSGRSMVPPSQLLLDERGVAEVLAVSERKVRELRAEGVLPSVRIGKSRRYHVKDVREFADRLREGDSSESPSDSDRQLVY